MGGDPQDAPSAGQPPLGPYSPGGPLDAYQKLQASEELYRYVVDLSGLVPWTADSEGEIVSVGARWTEWTGADVFAALDSRWLDFVHPDDLEPVRDRWLEAVRSTDHLVHRWRLKFANGCYRWIEARTRKRRDTRTTRALWYGTLEDVDERQLTAAANQRLQGELIHVSRLNAMGAMASVIAHDLNQPLTAAAHYIRGSQRLLRSGAADLEKAVAALEEADRNIVRSAEIVRRMREFVTRGDVERRPEPLKDLVEEACGFALADAARRGISHRSVFASKCRVFVDRIQIQQVVVNLLRNAVQAVSDTSRREIIITTDTKGNSECEVRVIDSGPGISEAAATRLFDPFYTTRKDGMGLGLAISRMIVEAHGGSIWTGPGEDGGTVVGFTLPTAQALSER